jgi:hypothetical protein
MKKSLTTILIGSGLLAGCTPEPPPARTVEEFVENPILLEAAMVRCAADRARTRYEQECINAREAVDRVEAKEEEKRRQEMEARSERKRQALRRTQQAQAEARRRAEEAERLREEAEYLAQFGVLPPAEGDGQSELPEGNVPIAVIPDSATQPVSPLPAGSTVPGTAGSNAPGVKIEPKEEPTGDPDDDLN